ncbi:hypothetical protein ABW21_db0200719 [Orbilia brochopaga]|nr:hypothetical protein ABW21_db0200719 [Drechslerella brochopaga]
MASTSAAGDVGDLEAWSIYVPPKPLPPVDTIKSICVIDFDNTLYQSPTPSNIWDRTSIGILRDQDHLLGGGWWQTPSILDATIAPDDSSDNAGSVSSSTYAVPDRWNDQMVNVARKAIEEPRTLSVLLTGRSRKLFSKTVLKILGNGQLDFDMVVLKQAHPSLGTRFPTTMGFKTGFLTSLLKKFHRATKISIYDDRPYHFRQFKEFGEHFNRTLRDHPSSRARVKFDCQHVPETHKNLNVLEEIKQVKFMLRRHNKMAQSLDLAQTPPPARLLKRVSKTGYMLSPPTTSLLLENFPTKARRGYVNTEIFGTCVPIKLGKCEPHELQALGGIGSRMSFEVVSYGSYDDCIWAVRVRPTNSDARISTIDETPTILLSKRVDVPDTYIDKIDNWENITPGDPRYLRFTATIGEQLQLQISERQEVKGAETFMRGSDD